MCYASNETHDRCCFVYLSVSGFSSRRRKRDSISELGDTWPLTVDNGTIGCTSIGGASAPYFVDPFGNRYGLSGHATTHMKLKEIDPIWKVNADGWGKINISPLREAALKLCN